MTTIADISVPQGAASTPVTVTAPAETVAVPARSITAPARTITLAAYSATISGRKVTVPSRTYSVPAYALTVPTSSVTAPAQTLSFNVLQAAPVPVPVPVPTPTPTPTAARGLLDASLLKPSSFLYITNGVNGMVYENLWLQGNGYNGGNGSALLLIDTGWTSKLPIHDLLFRNCRIGTNMASDKGNGVKIMVRGYGATNIVFDHCQFDYQPRLGFECNGRMGSSDHASPGGLLSYSGVNLTNCTFATCDGEPISYDDDSQDFNDSGLTQAGLCTIDNNLVGGAQGVNYPQWAKTFEINGPKDMTVTNNEFWAGAAGMANLQSRDGTDPCWALAGNVWDNDHVDTGVKAGNQPFFFQNVSAASKNVIVADQIICGAAGSWGYLNASGGLDFTNSTVDMGTPGQRVAPYMDSASGKNCVWPLAVG